MFSKFLKYAGPFKKKTIKSVIILIIAVFFSVLPFISAYEIIAPIILGEAITGKFIISRVIIVGISLLLNSVLYIWGLETSHYAAYNILVRIRIALQKKFEKLPIGIVHDKGVGTIKRLFVDDIDSLELMLAHTIPEGISNLLIPVLVYITMFFIDWKLAILSLLSLPLGLLAMGKMSSLGMGKMDSYYRSGKIMNNTIIEYINGMEVIKVFNKDTESYEKFRKDVRNYRDFTLDWYRVCWPWMSVYNVLLPCVAAFTLPIGSFFVLNGWSTLPHLILNLCLSFSIGIPLIKAIGFIPAFLQLEYKIDQLENILSDKPLKQNDNLFKGENYNIDFENITFAYKEKEVIHNISLHIKEGEKVAVVGESGSGKSTLAKLVIHYYDLKSGKISIGG